jgi:succinyl-CoA synthetase beta subunit
MNLHEYQAKQLFAEYKLPIAQGIACSHVQEGIDAIASLGGRQWVAKCQVHAGGRGKAGGVKIVHSKEEVQQFFLTWLGKSLVTFQTDAEGQPVHKILIETCTDIANELYLGLVLDRKTERVVVMASTEGGVDIESVAEHTPELIHRVTIDPLVGAQPYQGRQLAFQLNLRGEQVQQFTNIFLKVAQLFHDQDVALLEINPLVITPQGKLICLDAKINVDANALYRQPKLHTFYDPSQSDRREVDAEKWDLNYVALDGNIGCMVNGAGLAMATMDLVKLHGGEPANFLDVGGGATEERVVEAFKIILSDPKVETILVNIFGGIVRCDMIADGIIGAVKQVGVKVPVVVRLEGTNASLGLRLLEEADVGIIAATSLTQAVEQALQVTVVESE